MENNPIYDFLKANNLTSKDESSFISEYSDPAKAKELHGFFVQNNLTTKKFDDFYGEYFDVKKKDQQIPYGGQAFGGKEEKPLLPLTSSTASPSPSSQPKSTTPSVSTGKLPGLEIQVEKPVSTQAVDNKDLALTVESRQQRKQFLGEVNTGIPKGGF